MDSGAGRTRVRRRPTFQHRHLEFASPRLPVRYSAQEVGCVAELRDFWLSEVGRPMIPSSPVRHREVLGTLAAAVFAIGLTAIQYVIEPRSFFRDDMQDQYMPVFMSIGQAVMHGSWPILTLQVQNGGAFL